MSTGEAATNNSPFASDFGFADYAPQDTVVESMDESVRVESFDESNGPTLPPPSEMVSEEGFALREWRRLNAIRLAEKEKEEKAKLREIIEEADEFKIEFYKKRQITVENRKTSNREKEKQYLANQESFHAEAHKSYWKAIAELIPREVPAIEKKGKKDKDKQPSINVVMGPKPGKPTDMSRMRQVLVKLKHNPPPHMKPKPTTGEAEKDGKTDPASAVTNASGKAGSNNAVGKGSTSKPL